MPRVELYTICSNLDLSSGVCRRSRKLCGMAPSEHHECPDAAFVARVTKDGQEFQVLVDAHRRPTTGYIPIRTCRQIKVAEAPGVHVNSIATAGADRSLLRLARDDNGSVKYHLVATDQPVLAWSDDRFSVIAE